MTRRNLSELVDFEPDIEAIARRTHGQTLSFTWYAQRDKEKHSWDQAKSQGKLPSQTEPNPKENVSSITLRSGTVVEPPVQKQKEKPTNPVSQEESGTTTEEEIPTVEPEQSPYAEPPPFPSRFLKKDKQAEEKDILDIFRKVELNIPLLEVIRKIPRFQMANNTISLRSLLEKEKLNGINFLDWFRNEEAVIEEYVIEEAVPNDPGPSASKADKDKFEKHMDDMIDVECLMLATMTPEL
ncbi:hypothetical protein V6N13_081907 [Hibiscus sabdariffa]